MPVHGAAPLGVALGLLVAAGCGYRAAYGGAGGSERLHVVLVRAPVADPLAGDEVANGAREELAREGALAPGGAYPRVEIEVTRLDEASDAIGAVTGTGGALTPAARATEVGVVARAWITRAAGAPPERDTGDLRAFDLVGTTTQGSASADVAAVDALRHDDAVRAAARRLGVLLAERVLGAPVPTEDTGPR